MLNALPRKSCDCGADVIQLDLEEKRGMPVGRTKFITMIGTPPKRPRVPGPGRTWITAASDQ